MTPVAPALGGGGVLSLTEPDAVSETAAPVAEAPVGAFAALLEASLDYTAIIERDGRLRYLNPAARKLLAIEDDADVDGIQLADVADFLDNDRPEFAESARQAVRESGVHVAEGELLLTNGERRRVSMIMLALTDGDGCHRATVCVARDSTDLHAAEQRVIDASGGTPRWSGTRAMWSRSSMSTSPYDSPVRRVATCSASSPTPWPVATASS